MVKKKVLCPGYDANVGSSIFAVVESNGTLSFLPEAVRVDSYLISKLSGSPLPSKTRFRFAGNCIKGGCKQWVNGHCRLSSLLLKLELQDRVNKSVGCPISKSCRWFLQDGINVCKVCQRLPTEI